MDPQLKRGLLEICVLAAMRTEESYGYKLLRDVSPYIEISESTLYPILKRLEAAGSVISRSAEHNGRLRKYYSITEAGRARLDEFAGQRQQMMRIYSFIAGDEKNE